MKSCQEEPIQSKANGHEPFEAPVNRNPARLLTVPKTSCSRMVSTLPVAGSGRRSSILVPRETMISWVFGRPEKEPVIEWVMVWGGLSVRL